MATARPPRLLMGALLAVTVWGAVPPWIGPWLGWDVANVPLHVEIVDHAVPGVVLAVIAAAGLAGRLPLVAALVAVLAGLWMTATHVPLLGQAANGRVAWDAALFHSLPGLLILGVAITAAWWAWRADASAGAAPTGNSSARRQLRN